jgi:phage I-like protein
VFAAQQLDQITALAGSKEPGLRADALPAKLKLLNWGANASTKGKFIVNDTTVRLLPLNQRALGFERIALDFEHNTVPGTEEYKRSQEPRPVAAFANPVVIPGDGLYVDALDWRPAGAGNRANYEDLSPTVGTNDRGEVTFIHSVALCRNGSVHNLTIDSATTLAALTASANLNPPNTMSENNFSLATLATLMGLSNTATEADVKARFTALSTPPAATPPVITLSATVDGKAVTLTPTEMVERVISLTARLDAAEKAALDAQRAEVITALAADGKVPKKADGTAYSADELKALDVPTLRVLSANTPKTVPLSAQQRAAAASGNDKSEKTGAERAAAAWNTLEK